MARASIPQLARVDSQRGRGALDDGLTGDGAECLFAEKVVGPVVGVATDPEVEVERTASVEIFIFKEGSMPLFWGWR